jgi:glucuronosyltransferase
MKLTIFIAVSIIFQVDAAKILGVFPYPSKSHTILGQALFTELASRGHDVTFLTPYPLKKAPAKNYNEIVITSPEVFKVFEDEIDASFEDVNLNMIALFKFWFDNVAIMQEAVMSDKAVQKFLNSKEKFDVCVIEFLFNESLLGFGSHFDCKIIAMSTIGQTKYINDMLHSPMPLSVTPHPFLSYTDRMTFSQRMENIISTAIEDVGYQLYHYRLQGAIYDKYFKPDKPSFRHMLKHSVSLVLLNTHFSLNYPQAYLPNMVSLLSGRSKKNNKIDYKTAD